MKDWVSEHYRNKFRLAGHMARRNDGRWSARVLDFVPQGGGRLRGHPCKRWAEEIDYFFASAHSVNKGEWTGMAGNREVWRTLEDAFISFWMR